MPLFADVLVHRGDFTLKARVSVADGETLALLGPNGSGKSTLLAALAGTLVPKRASITVNGRVLTSVGAHVRATVIEPHERRVGLLGQDPLLFPHLNVRENIAFGRRSCGDSVAHSRTDADEWLAAVGLTGFAERRLSQLSGGQQQRVAIARALAAQPEVLLLDEPMAALDIQNASAVRTLLRERLTATALPTIVVSHNVVDAMVLADRVAIMDDGCIIDIGDPATVLGQPINQFAANLVGVNIIYGILGIDGAVHTEDGRRVRAASSEPLSARNSEQSAAHSTARNLAQSSVQSSLRVGEQVIAAFPPSAVRIATDVTARHDGFWWPATVGVLEPAVRGIRVPFVGETFAAEMTTAEILSSGLREGMPVTVSVDPHLVTVYRHRGGAPAMAE